MAGYSDRVFRALCAQQGADACYTEMVSAVGLSRSSHKSAELLLPYSEEERLHPQIFASTEDDASAGMQQLLSLCSPQLVDLNCGCPVPKVIKKGCGAALMDDPAQIERIVRAMSSYGVPVTIKIRTGNSSVNFLECAAAAVDGGACAVAIHGRSATQGYSGTADHRPAAKLVRTLPVPVIISGDMFSPEAVVRALNETGAHGVMLARGAVGRPWIFRHLKDYEQGAREFRVPVHEVCAQMRRHLRGSVQAFGEDRAVKEFRKMCAGYTRGLPGATALRREMFRFADMASVELVISEYESSLDRNESVLLYEERD